MSNKHQTDENLQKVVTPGALLRTAREAGGYLKTDVARQLCLSPQVVSEIENDEYTHFAAETYLIGYLRSYARLLQIDENKVCQAYKDLEVTFKKDSQVNPSSPSVAFSVYKMHSSRKKIKPGIAVVFILLLILLASGWWWQEQRVKLNNPVAKATTSKDDQLTSEISLSPKSIADEDPLTSPVENSIKKRMRAQQSLLIHDKLQSSFSSKETAHSQLQLSQLSKTHRQQSESGKVSSHSSLQINQNFTPDYQITAVKN